MITRLDWKEYFMNIACSVSLRSNCIRHQVGAIIVDIDNKIISTGYNGTPSKVVSCLERGICYRKLNDIPHGTRYETCFSLHSEMNAIIQAGIANTKGSSMFVYGHSFICQMCKRFIVQSELVSVYLKDSDNKIITILVEDIRNELNRI
jgi:dCMP deaminase